MFELCVVKNEIEILGFNSIYYFEFGKNFTHTPERHPFWEMVYVDSGRIIAITDGVGCTLNQGEIIFHEPWETHAHISDKETPNNMLVISFTTESTAMKNVSKKTFSADKNVKTLLSLFVAEAKNALGSIPCEYDNKNALDFSRAKFGSVQLLCGYLTELLIRLMRSDTDASSKIIQTEQTRAIAQSSLSELVIEYMRENLCPTLTLNDICKHFLIGKSQLSSIFKSSTGKSLMEYYAEVKISEAKRLLRSEEFSVSRISDMLGYPCIHSFSRAFKNKIGQSPSDYKKTVLKY